MSPGDYPERFGCGPDFVELFVKVILEDLMSEKRANPAIRVAMLPRDTNGHGSIFGGVILSYIDQAGAVEARKTARKIFVTKAMKDVIFIAPVYVGDAVSFYTRTENVGRTSVTVSVEVEVERLRTGELLTVTQATLTFVAVDENENAIPITDGA